MNQTAGTSQAIFAAALIGVAALLGVIVVMALRRRLLGRGTHVESDEISLSALRSLRDRGQLSEEEFAKARDVVLRAHGVERDTRRAASAPRVGDTEPTRPRGR